MNERKQDDINLEELIYKARENKSEEEILEDVLAGFSKAIKEQNKRKEIKDYSSPIYEDAVLMGRLANGDLEAVDVVEVMLYYLNKRYPELELKYTAEDLEKVTNKIFDDVDSLFELYKIFDKMI